MAETAKSGSKIDQIVYGISWAHKLAELKNPCQFDLVNFGREGAHRKIGHMITKKEQITPDILKKIVCTYGNTNCNLKDLRIASMCLICYSGFIRFSELVNLRRSDITFFPTYIKLFVVKVRLIFTGKGEMYLSPKQGYLHVLLTC